MDSVQAASGEAFVGDAVPRESQCLSCLACLCTWIPTDGDPPTCQVRKGIRSAKCIRCEQLDRECIDARYSDTTVQAKILLYEVDNCGDTLDIMEAQRAVSKALKAELTSRAHHVLQNDNLKAKLAGLGHVAQAALVFCNESNGVKGDGTGKDKQLLSQTLEFIIEEIGKLQSTVPAQIAGKAAEECGFL